MNIISMSVGVLGANCYIMYDEDNKEAMVIDPGGDGEYILEKIEQEKLKVRYILLTHGHFDHIGALKFLKEKTKGLVAIHKLDAENLTDGYKNLSYSVGIESIHVKPDLVLEHGNVVEFGNMQCNIIHTPGHTKGSICILIPGAIFTGDTLFQGSVGRTDLLGGNSKELIRSISEHLLVLDDNIVVYPGHGTKTTIGAEKAENSFLEGLV